MRTKILRDDGSTGLRLVQLDKESSLSMASFIYTQLPYKYKVIQYKTKHTYMVGIVIPLSNQSDRFPSIFNNRNNKQPICKVRAKGTAGKRAEPRESGSSAPSEHCGLCWDKRNGKAWLQHGCCAPMDCRSPISGGRTQE